VDDPRAEALRFLARRSRTVAEMLDRLSALGVEADALERIVRGLEADRYLDDARLAEEQIAARSARYGRARLLAELERRGVDRSTAEAAWDRLVASGELVPDETVARAAARRVAAAGGTGKLSPRGWGRIHASLVRAGFDEDEIDGVLGRHRDAIDTQDADGFHHELP
jgi:regulatory protein